MEEQLIMILRFPKRSRFMLMPVALLALFSGPAYAQEELAAEDTPALTPAQILDAAPADHWLPIPVGDLMILTLPDDAAGDARQAVIQLIPAAMSGAHVRNVRKLAAARWWDGTKIYRVAKDFVTQFGGQPDNKALPESLETVPESDYFNAALGEKRDADMAALDAAVEYSNEYQRTEIRPLMKIIYENYGSTVGFGGGWPIGTQDGKAFPLTCRGSLSPAHYDPPDAGTGAEISIVTGEEARGLDMTFGMVGRVIDGLEHLINLPLGTGAGGFYTDKSQHIPITSIQLASELPAAEQPRYEYLASYSPALLQYIDAHDVWGNICTVPVPIRKVAE